MTIAELSAFLIPFLFFLSLFLYTLIDRNRHLKINLSYPDFFSKAHFIAFPWGNIWVYDSNADTPPNPLTGPDRTTVLFIHSIGSSMYSWRYQIPEIQKHFRVIAFDLLGAGKSDKAIDQSYQLDAQEERIIALLDNLKIKQCALVGCSLGGALALWLAAKHKDRFTRVAAIAPAAITTVVPFYAIKHQYSSIAQKMVSRIAIRVALKNSCTHKHLITEDVVDHYFYPFTIKNSVSCFLKTVETLKDARIYKSLQTISCPTLILWGAKDRVVRKNDIQLIFNELTHAQKEIHKLGGHHLMEDESQWTNEKLLAFL